jgi:uncharacterized protein (TIGR03546 family)
MLFIIRPLAKLLAALNSNSKPGAVAAAVASAFLLALIPSANLLWAALFTVTMIIKLNWVFEIVFIALFKLLTGLIDPLIEPFGWRVMQNEAVSSFIYRVNEIPVLTFLGLNDSLMAGGLITGLVLWLPLYFITKMLVTAYREKLSPRIARSKIITAIKQAPFISRFLEALRQFSGMYA